MPLTGRSNVHWDAINQSVDEILNRLTSQMAKTEGVTESLNATDQMKQVHRMNSIRSRMEEVVMNDLMYA